MAHEEQEHKCCGGHGHGEGEEHKCCGGHGHGHGHGEGGCCGGHGHGEGEEHKCCGGHGHGHGEGGCCGGHGHGHGGGHGHGEGGCCCGGHGHAHDEDCGCGEDEYDDEPFIIEVVTDTGEEMALEVLEVFEFEDKTFARLMPCDEDADEDTDLLMECEEADGEYAFYAIEDQELLKRVVDFLGGELVEE